MKAADLVVLRLCYVGLPLVREAVGAGLCVAGFDPDRAKGDGSERRRLPRGRPRRRGRARPAGAGGPSHPDKTDIGDERESPARPIATRLLELGAELSFHDPYVESWQVGEHRLQRADLDEAVAEAECVVVVQSHAAYDLQQVADRSRLLFDTRGCPRGERVSRL